VHGAKLRAFGMVLCPEGVMGLSPGFQPLGTIQPKRVALNGRKLTWPISCLLLPKKGMRRPVWQSSKLLSERTLETKGNGERLDCYTLYVCYYYARPDAHSGRVIAG
jgi:hypothetical protein